MRPSLYHLSEEAIDAAALAESKGNEEEARQCYLRAAELQERWAAVSSWADRPRTRSTFTRSAACLYLRAGALDDALRLAQILTTTDGVIPAEVAKGHEIIAAVEKSKAGP